MIMAKDPKKKPVKKSSAETSLLAVLACIGRTRAGAYRVVDPLGMEKALKAARLTAKEILTAG